MGLRWGSMTREEREALELIEREFDAEREDERLTLQRERFGAPVEPAVVCWVCGVGLAKNDAGFWCHAGATTCQRPVVSVEEVSR